jgi:hypothetical protein
MIRVLFRVFRNSYSPMTCSFRSLWSRIRSMVEVITIGGGLSHFLGASCSVRVFSAPVASVSMSMSLVQRGAKKLRVMAALVGALSAADFGIDIVDFLVVSEVSLEIWLLHLFTSWKSSSWGVDCNEVLLTPPL